jgi:hypothetical protein
MARRVFFSFHYGRDLWRVNVVRNSGVVEGVSAAGFHDASVWDETRKEGAEAIKKLIDSGLDDTSVTVVLIGAETASRTYVSYEIEKSVARGNGILGIRIDKIRDKDGKTESPGPVPPVLARIGAPIYDWEYGRLGEWVERAYKTANSPA